MDLILTGDLARHVLAMTKNDKRLARIMARELLAGIDRKVMAAYLLTDDLALDLLALRLSADLDTTLAELEQLATGKLPSRRTARARRARPVAKKQARPKKRAHVTATQVAAIKTRVQAVVRKGPASRNQICSAVKFPSVSVYNRIMGELRTAGVVIAKGKRGKTVYVRGKAKRATRRSR
jgi:hypothetical protein